MRNVLLMTATITPLQGLPAMARTDPIQRLNDYCCALAFYQKLPCFTHVVFAENSESDLGQLREQANDKVEFVSFDGLGFPPSHGRGYGEMELIDHAMGHSRALRQSDIVVWKVTGRYICRNIEEIVGTFPKGSDLYCHMRNHPYRLCELFMLAFTALGYEQVIKGVAPQVRNDIRPGVHTIEETLFRDIVDEKRAAGLSVTPRFRRVPVIEGVRGWNNSAYSDARSAKIQLRRVTNMFAPWLWI